MDVSQEVNQKSFPEPSLSKQEAAYRVIKHWNSMSKVNPFGADALDDGMRSTLTLMLTGKKVKPQT